VFAHAGATVWFAGRDDAKTRAVVDAVAAEVGPGAAGRLHTLHLDLSSLASVRAAAAEFLATGQPLHILLNNAGGCPGPT
jgi:retinol dehydrogenase-12